MSNLFYQIHGYKSGHQLLSDNIRLNRVDQDCIDRLSDISGSLKPGELFEPYLTCYPLPSIEYFIIARTWQDLTVQRAGCVITKSLIIPMTEWLEAKSIKAFFEIVLAASANKNETFNFKVANSVTSIPPAVGIPAQELVEALFLENRQPIVVFNCSNIETVVIRLYTAFWASLRSTFSTCTYSLSQRSLTGKPFDLLFAPSSVKSKFAEWNGRRIDASTNVNKSFKRRWTEELATSIFIDPLPTLATNSTDIIKNAEGTDESNLKLNLLWKELLFKAETESSPLAILGLLDIINSQTVFATELYRNLRPYIFNAIQTAGKKLSEQDAWKFYAALLVKHRRKQMDREMLVEVRKQCAELTERNSDIAVDFITNYRHPSNAIPSILFTGIGDGLAEKFEAERINLIQKLTVETFLSLVAASKKFVQKIVKEFKPTTISLLKLISLALESSNKRSVLKAKKNFSQYIDKGYQAELLVQVMHNIDPQIFKVVVTNLAKNTAFSIREFDSILLSGADQLYQYEFLKDTLETYDKTGKADSLLVSIIKKEPIYLSWLLFQSSAIQSRKNFITIQVLGELSNRTIDVIANDRSLSDVIVNIVINEDSDSELVATVVIFANIAKDRAISILKNVSKSNIRKTSLRLITPFLLKLFEDDSINDNDITNLLNKVDEPVISALIELWHTQRFPAIQILRGIKLLFNSGQSVSEVLVENIVWVSGFLANNLGNDTTEELTSKWADLLHEAKHQKEQYQEAAAIMMNFAYKNKSRDPTELLLVSFPIVYKSFLHDNPIGHILPFLYFSDWDKCKTLRQDLVYRYLNSEWSAFGLFAIAFEADIVKEVFSIVLDSPKGKNFLNEALVEIQSSKIKHPVIKDIKRQIKHK